MNDRFSLPNSMAMKQWMFPLMRGKNIYYALAIVSSIALITYLHYSTLKDSHALHYIYAELHFIPIILGAIAFGMRGAILSFALVSGLYLPYILSQWGNTFSLAAEHYVHILFSAGIAVLAGFLVDRERKLREQAARERYLAGLGQVATTIVHDLKNPLITILAYTRRALDGKGTPDTLKIISDAAGSMQRIVHDVLDFARPIKQSLQMEDVRKSLTQAVDSCRTKAEESGIILHMNMPNKEMHIYVDSAHMERAFVNVISNAIDASSRCQTVEIDLQVNKTCAEITIRDHGEGMDQDVINQIFIPFYTKKSYGTGLGMPIAKKIIEGHNGNISIHSRPGAGTEAIIELPLL